MDRAAREPHVASLRALVAHGDVVGDAVTLDQLGEPAGQRADVDEHVVAAGLGGDEPEALVGVVPGHGAVGSVGRRGWRGGGAERQEVVGLRALLAVDDEERDPLPLRDDAAPHDRRAVHEDLGATAVGREEAVSLARLVPGDGAEHAEGRVGGVVARDPDAACLRTAGPFAQLELDHLPLAELLRPVVTDDLGRVHEQVLGVVLESEEAEPPLGVEPTDGSLGHG